jgi:hypothetical protein
MPRTKKQPPQSDAIEKNYTVETIGTDFDLMIEAGRIEAARVLRVRADQLFVRSHSPLAAIEHTPFRANLSVPSRAERFSMRITFAIKIEDSDVESPTSGGEDQLDDR